MSDKPKMIKILTPPFRVSFPNVFKAASNFKNVEPTFSIQMLFPKNEDLSLLKKAEITAARRKWPLEKPAKYQSPFRDGDEKNLENYKDMTVVNAKTKFKPGIIDKDKNEIIDPSDFYPGCWARATINAFAYDTAGNVGVSFGLQNIQKLKDDTSFSGRTNAADDFEVVESDGEDWEGDDWEK